MSCAGAIAATPPASKARRRHSPSPPRRPAAAACGEAPVDGKAGNHLSTPRANAPAQLQPESALKAPRPGPAIRLSFAVDKELSTPKRRTSDGCSGSGSARTPEASTRTPGLAPRVLLRQVDLADVVENNRHVAAGDTAEPGHSPRLREAARALAARLREEESAAASSASGVWREEETTTYAILLASQPDARPVGLLRVAAPPGDAGARPHGVPCNAVELQPAELRARARGAPEVVPILENVWIEPSFRRQGLAREALQQAFSGHEHLVVEAPVATVAQGLEALGWVLCGSRWARGRSFLCRYIRRTLEK